MSNRGRIRQWRKRLFRRWKQKPGVVPWLLALPVRTALFVLRTLPARFSLWVVERAGRFAWLSSRRKNAGRFHISQAFPGMPADEVDRLGKTSCGKMARSLAESLLLAHRHTPETIMALMDYEPGAKEIIESRVGKGGIFVQGHFGAMEAMDCVLGVLGGGVATPMRMPNNYYLGADMMKARDGWGVTGFARSGALRKMIAQLRNGGNVMLAADQNAHHAPIFLRWFGRLAASDRAAAYLAIRTGYPLVVSWAVCQPGKIRWTIGCKVVREAQEPTKVEDEALLRITGGVHAALEAAIRKYPDQYLWIHDRYRTRPAEEAAQQEPAEPAEVHA